jgi:hypothetical protein
MRQISESPCMISGFRRDVDEICTLLGYYAALSGSPVATFRGNQSVPPSRARSPILTLEDGTGRLSRNVGTEIPLNVA